MRRLEAHYWEEPSRPTLSELANRVDKSDQTVRNWFHDAGCKDYAEFEAREAETHK